MLCGIYMAVSKCQTRQTTSIHGGWGWLPSYIWRLVLFFFYSSTPWPARERFCLAASQRAEILKLICLRCRAVARFLAGVPECVFCECKKSCAYSSVSAYLAVLCIYVLSPLCSYGVPLLLSGAYPLCRQFRRPFLSRPLLSVFNINSKNRGAVSVVYRIQA